MSDGRPKSGWCGGWSPKHKGCRWDLCGCSCHQKDGATSTGVSTSGDRMAGTKDGPGGAQTPGSGASPSLSPRGEVTA